MPTVEPTLGPRGAKKILVASHERSGTHFLMNTIADNFGYVSEPWADIDDDRVVNPYAWENIRAYLEQFAGRPILNLFKTHYPIEFFEGLLDWLLAEFNVVYIHRNVDDCLRSLQRHVNDLPWKAGPKTNDYLHFKWSPPSGALLRYQLRQYDRMVDRHQAHVAGYLCSGPACGRIHVVKYEDLDQDFAATVERLSQALNLFPLHVTPQRPARKDTRQINETRFHKEETHG